MGASSFIGVIIVVFIFAALVRFMAGGIDKDRVRAYIEDQGGRLLDTQWSPFGTGWAGEKNARIYRVQFEDRYGNIREATVKTSMFSGVYFTEDIIVVPASTQQREQTSAETPLSRPHPAVDPAELAQLRAENARLKEELARARQSPQPLFGSDTKDTSS